MTRINIAQHIGLAHLACRNFKAHVGRGFDYEDLVQAACEGLLYAAISYDEEKGKFSTYAVPMAKKFVKRLVATQARTVKCPEYTQDRGAKAGVQIRPAPEAPRERRTTGGPFDWTSAAPAIVPPNLVAARLPYAGVPTSWGVAQPDPWDVPRDAAGERKDGKGEPDMVHSPGSELSLDYSRSDDGGDSDSTMHDYLGSESAPTPEDLAAARQVSKANARLWSAMSVLNEKQIAVVCGRLDGQSGPEIAASMSLSKERVRQIQEEATGLLTKALAPVPNLN
jgi:RNA polymerase sigma factor (sigma-70 family)